MRSLNEIFVTQVKKLLGERTAYWLANESGVTQATLSRILAGQSNTSLEIVEKIAKGFGVEPGVLLSLNAKKHKVPSDIVSMLEDQPDFVYEAVRGILRPLIKAKVTD